MSFYKTDRDVISFAFQNNCKILERLMAETDREKKDAKIWAEGKQQEERKSFLLQIFGAVIPIIKFLGNHYGNWSPNNHLLQGGFVDSDAYIPPRQIPQLLITNMEELQRIELTESKSCFWYFWDSQNSIFSDDIVRLFSVVNNIIGMKGKSTQEIFNSFYLAKLCYEANQGIDDIEHVKVRIEGDLK